MSSELKRPTPPRFVTRTLIAMLATIAFVLSAVLFVVTLSLRDHVRRSVVEKLETGQHLLATLEERRLEDLRAQVATLAEDPTLKAALDRYHADRRTASPEMRAQLIATVGRELGRLAVPLETDVLAARDMDGTVLAVSGRRAAEWTAESQIGEPAAADATFLTLPSGVFRAVTVPVTLQYDRLGSVQLAQALDDRYATRLSELSGAHTLVVSQDRILATTLPPETVAALTPPMLRSLITGGLVSVAGEEYAVRPLLGPQATLTAETGAAVYVLDSIDASARPVVRSSLQTMGVIGLGALALAALAGLWLARTISQPIDTLSGSLTAMTRTRSFDRPLPLSGASLEVDGLTAAFNSMVASITAAEAETSSAYLDAIRALALALDARDPFTAGHSERVSALSVAIGREMRLDEPTLEVLRLGALLHDIGKMGISASLLRKPGKLTADEYEVVKTHPTVGSRLLRRVRFLKPHLPVVELHHERPDGKGYPYGLAGDQIPVLARIVHVADAYDAMTCARAYRPALPATAGLNELRRCAGTDFDRKAVDALAAVLSRGEPRREQGDFALEGFRPEAGKPNAGAQAADRSTDPLDAFASEGGA